MKKRALVPIMALLISASLGQTAQAAPVQAPIIGEIERITINNANDPWSGGTIVVDGAAVILPKNLLIDLPANRVTLKHLFDQAPAACLATGETGLAKADVCNATGAGGLATIAANMTNGGNTIAGDVFIQKGVESVTGPVTYINHTDGYFRINGVPGDPNTGIMIRINDPTSRHTVQQGLGCAPVNAATGRVPSNCSPDPRFNPGPGQLCDRLHHGLPRLHPEHGAPPVSRCAWSRRDNRTEYGHRHGRRPLPGDQPEREPHRNRERFSPVRPHSARRQCHGPRATSRRSTASASSPPTR